MRFNAHDYEMIGLRSSVQKATPEKNNTVVLETLLAAGCANALGGAAVARLQGSAGADFHRDLRTDGDLIIRKGFRPLIDSYSGFFENDQKTPTGLDGYLRSRGVSELTFVGLATDFCVAFSALDAVKLGFKVHVDLTACRGIDLEGSLEKALTEMQTAGVQLQQV